MPKRRKPPKITFEDRPCARGCGEILLVQASIDPAPIGWPPPWHGVCRNCQTEAEKDQILGNSGAGLVAGHKSET